MAINNQDYQIQVKNLDNQIAQLNKLKQQYQDIYSKQNYGNVVTDTLWNKINEELQGVNQNVLNAISKDADYQKVNNALQNIVQQELLLLVKDKVENREDGKSLLTQQIDIIKNIKERVNKTNEEEMMLFTRFKEYSKLHPNTTYEEFLTKSK